MVTAHLNVITRLPKLCNNAAIVTENHKVLLKNIPYILKLLIEQFVSDLVNELCDIYELFHYTNIFLKHI